MTGPDASGAAETAAELVLDVTLSCAWCFADEANEPAWAILEQLQTGRAHVPALWLLEGLPISIDQPTTASTWHDTLALARSHRLTSYDAAYLELAQRRGLPLATRDKALQEAARLEGVALLPC